MSTPGRPSAVAFDVVETLFSLDAVEHALASEGAGHRAELTTGWASRLEGTFPSVFDSPDVSGADLVEVVDALLALDNR